MNTLPVTATHRRSTSRDMYRVAAIADLHLSGSSADLPRMRALVERVNQSADVLALCGDLTCHGRREELGPLLDATAYLEIPVVAVFGNHDYEDGSEDALEDALLDCGVTVLDGSAVEIDGIGFAGVKGFGGGFEPFLIGGFGETALKQFVRESEREAEKLEIALKSLATVHKVVLTHYAPVQATLTGEPEPIWPFLGSSRLARVIDAAGASAVFHGHAHLGSPVAATPNGVPVFNVAEPVLRRHRLDVRIWSTRLPRISRTLALERPGAHAVEQQAQD